MRKKKAVWGIAVSVIMFVTIGGAIAAHKVDNAQMGISHITTKELKVKIVGESQTENKMIQVFSDVSPGTKIENKCYVTNLEESGYPMYVRVTLCREWGAKSKEDAFEKDYTLDTKRIGIEPTAPLDWIKGFEDEEQTTYYYKFPLQSGESTSNFLEIIKIDSKIGNTYADKKIRFSMAAEAVQAIAGKDAMESVWGIEAVFDEEGTITNIHL